MQKPQPSNFTKLAFVALFGAMVTVGAFRAIPKSGTNLLQGVLSPLPQSSLLVGSPPNSQNDEPADVAKFFSIEWTTNGVEMVLHRPEEVSTDALEVTLVGSTNLVTATWSPFMNVTFPAGDTNVSVTVSSAMLDAHSVSNACFFAFINSGDSDADGLFDWDERFNFKTDPYDAFSVMGALESSGVTTGLGQAYKDFFAVKFGGHSPEEVLDDGHTVYEHALYTGTWNGELPSDPVLGSGDVQVTLSIDKRRCPDASTLRIGDIAIPLVLTDGADSAISVSVDRSARPCHAALSAEESDVGALLQEFYEQASLDFEASDQMFYGQQLRNLFSSGVGIIYDSQGIDVTTQTEHGEFRLPPGGPYPVPPYVRFPPPPGVELILVLDPVMMCDDGTCADALRLVHDPDGGTYSVDDGYPFDTACLRRGHASGEDGSSPFAEPAIDPGVGEIPFDVVSWWTDTVDGCHTGAVSVCGHEVWWAGHEAHHASCPGFDPADPLSDRCGCCADGCANGSCDALESPEGGRRLRFRIPFGQPRKGQVSGFCYLDADGPLSVAPGVFRTAMRGPELEGTPGVDAGNRPETVYACADERGRDIHVRQETGGVELTVRDHATGRLEHTWQIGNVDGSSSRVRFRQISRLGNPMQDATFDWDASKGSWSKSDGISGLREEVEIDDRLSDDGSPTLVETRTRSDAEGTLLVRTVREWSRLGSGSHAALREVRRREQRFDPGAGEWIDVAVGAAEYWGEESRTSKFGKVRLVSGSDRAWEYHDYDDEGRESLRVEQRNGSSVPDSFPWLDGDGALQIPPGFGDAFVTVFGYGPLPGDDGSPDDAERPRVESRHAVRNGSATLTARTWRRYTHPTQSGIPCVKCETWRAAAPGASFGDAGNAYSYTVVYDEDAAGVPLAARGETAESTSAARPPLPKRPTPRRARRRPRPCRPTASW